MNILEALDTSLPELPGKSGTKSYPKLHPDVIFKEHLEHEVPTILAKVPGADNYVRFSREQWALAELFDGNRSYVEITQLVNDKGIGFLLEDVMQFSAFMKEKTDLFYRSPLETNTTLRQKLGHAHKKRNRFKFADVTDITLHRWPHADAYLTKLQPYVEFFYTPWCTIVTLLCFAAMVLMWADKFGEVWRDSFEFYNFTSKTGWDLLEFWFLFGAMAFFHESAHGMTCKHFGGKVERIELLLMYFAPTFACDCSQIWVLGDKRARLYTIIAGLWFDLVLCFFATAFWWATAPGMFIHDFSYKVMMVTGIGMTLLNLNPLLKLDGYYIFSEVLGESDLYEGSAAYLSNWIKKHILRLPVEVEYLTRRRRVLYLVYGVASVLYGLSIIVLVVLFAYHVMRSFSPEFAWIPGLLLAYFMFRSRVRGLVRLMKEVYLDKKERARAWFTPLRIAASSVIVLGVLVAPVWPDFVQARFMLEPAQRAVIRTQVQGVVSEVLARENEVLPAGAIVVRMRNPQLASEAAAAQAVLQQASARAVKASLSYTDFGRANHELREAADRSRIVQAEVGRLNVNTPLAGVVATPRLQDLRGRYLPAGTVVADVIDVRTLLARIYIPEYEVRDVRVGAPARLHMDGRFWPVTGKLIQIAPGSSELDPALVEKEQLAGIVPPPYYSGEAYLTNDGGLRVGMRGTAKIFVRRRSAAEMGVRFFRDVVERRLW
jgi:putative peptide zinc metalloprotease protein